VPTISFNNLRNRDGLRLISCVVVCHITPSGRSADCVQRTPLGLRPDVAVTGQHLRGNVPRNRHDGLVARLRFGKLRDGVVPQMVEAEASRGALNFADVGSAGFVAAL
jgi:hypothetical protein